MDIIKQFNLPGYVKGKSFSDASKAIMNKFKDREDNTSKKTMAELLSRLKSAQEFVKQQETESIGINENAYGGNQYFLGGLFGSKDAAAGVAGATDGAGAAGGTGPGIGGYMQAAQGAIGIGQDLFGKVDNMSPDAQEVSGGASALGGAAKGAQAGMAFGPWGAAIGGVLGGIGGLVGGGKKNDAINKAKANRSHKNYNQNMNDYAMGGFTEPGPGDKDKKKKQATTTDSNFTEDELRMINESTGISFTPEGANQLFMKEPPFEKPAPLPDLDLGRYKDVGYYDVTMNGNKYVVKPSTKNYKNAQGYKDDMNYLRKLNPNAKFDKFMSNGNYVTNKDRRPQNYTNESRVASNDFKKGGYTNKYDGITLPTGFLENLNKLNNIPDLSKLTGTSDDFHTGDNSIDYRTSNSNTSNKIDPIKSTWNIDTPKGLRSDAETGKRLRPDGDEKGSKVLDWLGDNKGDILRYAPAITNAIQLAGMKRPEKEQLAKLGNRYERQFVDERSLINNIQNSFNDNYLTESSGGSSSRFATNARAAQLAKTKAVSDAYMKAEDINRNENRTAQQFNLGVDQFNTNVLHKESENFARDLGAYNTEKSKLIGALGENIGGLGTEMTRDDMIKELFDYTRKGKYINKKSKGGSLDSIFDYISSQYMGRMKK